MLGWLIALCLLVIAPSPAAPPMVVVAAMSATGVVTYPAVLSARAECDGLRDDAGLPEDPDHHDHAPILGCAGCSGLRGREGCSVVPDWTAVAAAVSGL
jgi:hypothetical protein